MQLLLSIITSACSTKWKYIPICCTLYSRPIKYKEKLLKLIRSYDDMMTTYLENSNYGHFKIMKIL